MMNKLNCYLQDEPMPSTSSSRGASAHPTIRIPPPRMQAFAVPSNLNSADDPMHGAKRKQIETRQRQLDSLKKIEDRYKNLQKEEVKSKEPKLSNSNNSAIPEKMKTPHSELKFRKKSKIGLTGDTIRHIRHCIQMF